MNEHEFLIEMCAAILVTKRECKTVHKTLIQDLFFDQCIEERLEKSSQVDKQMVRRLAFSALRPDNRM